jgi:hypothetical protein
MATKTTELRQALESKTRDELNVLGRRMNIANFRRLSKEQLVDSLLVVPSLAKQMHVSWWDLHHNHVYGVATLVALVLSIVFYLWPLVAPPVMARNQVAQFNRYGSLSLNLERRNALQNKLFGEWIERTKIFKQRYATDQLPTKNEYETFILQFTEFAENAFTPLQVKSFQGLESGAGGEMFRHPDGLSDDAQNQFIQLALIEYWLQHYIELNLKSEEPLDPEKMMI